MRAPVAMTVLDAVPADVAKDGVDVLRSIVGRTVDGHPEAWVLAGRMLPDYEGTISELLFTAAAAAA